MDKLVLTRRKEQQKMLKSMEVVKLRVKKKEPSKVLKQYKTER